MTREEWLNKMGVKDETESPRLVSLAEHIQAWFDQYTDEDFKDKENGMGILLLAHDNKAHRSLKYQLLYEEDPRESLVQTINHGIGDIFYNKESNEIFNSFTEYLIRVFIKYPELWEKFQNFTNDKINKKNV